MQCALISLKTFPSHSIIRSSIIRTSSREAIEQNRIQVRKFLAMVNVKDAKKRNRFKDVHSAAQERMSIIIAWIFNRQLISNLTMAFIENGHRSCDIIKNLSKSEKDWNQRNLCACLVLLMSQAMTSTKTTHTQLQVLSRFLGRTGYRRKKTKAVKEKDREEAAVYSNPFFIISIEKRNTNM